MVQRNRLRRAALAGAGCLVMAAALAGCASKGSSTTNAAKGPLVIGASVSLTGDFADSGKAVKAGYQLWGTPSTPRAACSAGTSR